MFHRHRWERVGNVYMPPNIRLREVTGYDEETFLKIMYGVTNITLRCSCGDEKVVTAIGEAV